MIVEKGSGRIKDLAVNIITWQRDCIISSRSGGEIGQTNI
jgi:hypothetical protein